MREMLRKKDPEVLIIYLIGVLEKENGGKPKTANVKVKKEKKSQS